MYIGGGAYPITKGPNPLWIYDIGADRWEDPTPDGVPGGNHFGTNVAVMSCDSRKDRVYLSRYRGKARGAYVYDAKKNAWRGQPSPLPGFWANGPTASWLFHPGLGVQFVFVAHDSQDNGRIFVYRPSE